MASNIQLLDGGVLILPPRTPRPAILWAMFAGMVIVLLYGIAHALLGDRDLAFVGFAISACCAAALIGGLWRRSSSVRNAIWIADSPGAMPPQMRYVISPERTFLSTAVRGIRLEFEPERGEPRDGHFCVYVDFKHSSEPLLVYAARRSFLGAARQAAQNLADRWRVSLVNNTSF